MSATGPESFAGTTQGQGPEQPEGKQPEREARKQARKEAKKQERREVKKRERRKKELEEREHGERAQVLEALGIPTGDASASMDRTE
jgi:hypothetical protein